MKVSSQLQVVVDFSPAPSNRRMGGCWNIRRQQVTYFEIFYKLEKTLKQFVWGVVNITALGLWINPEHLETMMV
jgi:hypothetical protein